MTEFAGRTIEGDVSMGDAPKEQHADELLVKALDELLAVEGVEAVRWRQYTPYFNDGDPCVFSAHGVSVKLIDAPEDAGDYGDGFQGIYELEKDHPARKPLETFHSIVDGGHHDGLLIKQFGDHAEITATKEKFVVDFYKHD